MFNTRPSRSTTGKTKNGVDIGRTLLMPDKKNQRICFVVASRSTALIYEKTSRMEQPRLIKTLSHPEGREHFSNLYTDTAGRVFEGTHTGTRSSYERSGIYDETTHSFCRTIARELIGLCSGARTLMLVASPQVLGFLRQEVSAKALGVDEIVDMSKDLSKLNPSDLAGRLNRLVAL